MPAVRIGTALVERGHAAGEIHFVGSARGVEATMVPEAGFPITLLPGRGIQRKLTPANLRAVGGLLVAGVRAVGLVRRLRPEVVVSVGGYAGAPAALAAVLLRRPLVLAESNAVPGASNRLVGRFARSAAVAFDGTALPHAVTTGNPVRPQILAVDRSYAARAAAREALGLPADRFVVAVFGGSLGSRRINTAIRGVVDRWAGRDDVAIRHAVGRRDWAAYAADLPSLPAGGLVYQPVEYEDRMETVYAAADVAVCRAGGSTCAELGVVGLPAVYVPLPGAPGDHQTFNARGMVDRGAGVLIADGDLDADRLAAELDALAADPDRVAAMAKAAAALGRPDAAERVADLVEEAANR